MIQLFETGKKHKIADDELLEKYLEISKRKKRRNSKRISNI